MKKQQMKAQLIQAAQTLQALPVTSRTCPMGHKSAWPEMKRPSKRGAILHRGTMRASPNSQDITDCYKIIDALYLLSDLQRKLLWARAHHIPWALLQQRLGRSRTHLNRLYDRALADLEAKLQK